MENQQVNMTSNQTTSGDLKNAGVSTYPQVPATGLNNNTFKGSHSMKQYYTWRFDSISCVDSSDD